MTLKESTMQQSHYTWNAWRRRNRLWADHPSTLISISNLASLYKSQGHKHDAAESLYLECAEKAEATLGPDHPHTLLFLKNISSTQNNLNHNQ
jgi:hypothetical protein